MITLKIFQYKKNNDRFYNFLNSFRFPQNGVYAVVPTNIMVEHKEQPEMAFVFNHILNNYSMQYPFLFIANK